MRNVDTAIQGFVEAIKASEEYRDYAYEKNRVKQFPELKAQIDEFRRRNFEIQCSDDAELETIEQFEKQYMDFTQKPMVADFLAAELALCRMIQEINLKVTESLEFE